MSDPLPELPLDRFLDAGGILHVAADGQMLFAESGRCSLPRALLPGSFNPLHRGHWDLAKAAEQLLQQSVAFEISVANVDKPTLAGAEIRRRLTQFDGQASVWLTHAAKFVEKAECFPGATFVVGADTAMRIVLPRYYNDNQASMFAALTRMRELGCRFLVACRVDVRRECLRASDLPIPPSFHDLFAEIPPEQFRWDLSSTVLRGESGRP